MSEEKLPRCDFRADKLLMKFEMDIPASVEGITPAVSRVMGIVQEMKCADGKEFYIETALREALANAIIHGAKLNPEMSVQVVVACDEGRGILIIVRDPGRGFSPESIPSPILGQNIFSTHGRGIFLINQLMDHVEYHRGGTEIHMLKR